MREQTSRHGRASNMGRIAQLTHSTSGTAPVAGSFGSGALAGHRYVYDDASRVTSRTSLWRKTNNETQFVGAVTYGYDHLNQLKTETRDWDVDDSYQYDASGNRTQFVSGSSTIDYELLEDGNNRLESDTNYTYTYDADGNLTQKETGANVLVAGSAIFGGKLTVAAAMDPLRASVGGASK